MASRPRIRLPRQWPKHIKPGILHAISLASVAVTAAQGRVARRHALRSQLEARHALRSAPSLPGTDASRSGNPGS